MDGQNVEYYDYIMFSKDEKVRVKVPIRARTFVGGFKDIFKDKDTYKYITIPPYAIVTIVHTPEQDSNVSWRPLVYSIRWNDVVVGSVPEYALDKLV